MGLFDCLPTVDNCCFCISLKIGSILIALCTMGYLGSSVGYFYYSVAGAVAVSQYDTISNIIAYVMFAVEGLLTLASIIFLIGIALSIPETATIYLCALSLSLVLKLVYIVSYIILCALSGYFGGIISSIINPILSFLLWIYFMIVVKSYEEEMD